MIKVITYGSFDLLHYGHIRLLERAKALGDYLIVGVTSDDFDKTRGKINLQQSLMERIEAVKATGIPDEVIVEEYEGQKIDDIVRYGVDIFAIGSDWDGYFDYLKEYCKVVYLPRTEGVSSSEIRAKNISLKLGLVGSASFLEKVLRESQSVNGIDVTAICSENESLLTDKLRSIDLVSGDLDEVLDAVDAVYIHSYPAAHYEEIKSSIMKGKHVLCESPLSLDGADIDELHKLAEEKGVVLMEGIRTAYSTAFHRMLLLIKAGKIGDVVSVDSTCTNLKSVSTENAHGFEKKWNSLSAWGPTGLLPVFQILGTDYKKMEMISRLDPSLEDEKFDLFTKLDFIYENATASVKVGRGVKSEGQLIVSGTEGYIYVPSPWWKTDYFELRFEDPADNKRYFYQLDGEGVRYELVAFVKAVLLGSMPDVISSDVSKAISDVMHVFETGKDVDLI